MVTRSILRPVLRPVTRAVMMDDDGPSPAFSANFLSGVLPAGLTYTNSSTVRTYFGSDGLLKTAAANEAIFEYNPLTLALLGMRWEMEQRTNLAPYSTLPGGGAAPTGWTQPLATGTSAPAASIYGNADGAVAYAQSATAGRPALQQSPSPSVAANTTYSFSFLIESVSGGLTASQIISATGLPAGAVADYVVCDANPAGTSGGTVTTGVMRITVVTSGTAGTAVLRCGIGVSANATGTLKFSRPQFEAGASRSSFIPTTTAAVTRQPDVLTATSISPWFNASEGTVVFEGIASELAASGRAPVGFHNGTIQNRIALYLGASSANFRVLDANVEQANITIAGATAGSIFRHVGTYKASDFSASFNGASGTPDTSGTVPTITTLSLGVGTSSSGLPFMGYARRFQYFNTRLPDPTIQGLSRV